MLLGLAAAACGAVACGGPSTSAPATGPVPGVVIVCVDTLRADALHLPGGFPGRLPSIGALAGEGVLFADATAAAPWTSPSVASLLTGLHATHHGVGLGVEDTVPRRIAPALHTLAEILQEKGWSTAAGTGGGWVTHEQGFDAGFERFSSDFDLVDPGEFVLDWDAWRPKDRPFLLFLHTFVAHDPYGEKLTCADLRRQESPEALRIADRIIAAADRGDGLPLDLYTEAMRVRWTDSCGRVAMERRLGPERMRPLLARTKSWVQGEWNADEDAGDRLAAHLRSAYNAGMSVVDRRLEGTFRAIEAAHLPPGTVVIFTGDHGEAFGEDGQLYHGQTLHDAVLRVPLIVRAPGRLPAGRLVEGGASLVDVLPTVLDLAGIPVPQDLDGRSLVPLARGEAATPPVLAEGQRAATDDHPAVGLVAVRTPAVKWILEYDVVTGISLRERLYDLTRDAGETDPLPSDRACSYGPEFCLAVTRAREEIARRYGLPAVSVAVALED